MKTDSALRNTRIFILFLMRSRIRWNVLDVHVMMMVDDDDDDRRMRTPGVLSFSLAVSASSGHSSLV